MGPLAVILGITAFKDGYEDYKRHVTDKSNAEAEYLILRKDGNTATIRSSDIMVGDILWLKNGQEIPADVVVLATSDDSGACYISTANLDGETSLKIRSAPPLPVKLQDRFDLAKFEATLTCCTPNPLLEHFNGSIDLDGSAGLAGTLSVTPDSRQSKVRPHLDFGSLMSTLNGGDHTYRPPSFLLVDSLPR